jgi:hypothetical protein
MLLGALREPEKGLQRRQDCYGNADSTDCDATPQPYVLGKGRKDGRADDRGQDNHRHTKLVIPAMKSLGNDVVGLLIRASSLLPRIDQTEKWRSVAHGRAMVANYVCTLS